MSNKQDSSSTANTAAASQQQRTTGHCQHSLHSGNVVKYFLEHNDVQVTILTTCIVLTTITARMLSTKILSSKHSYTEGRSEQKRFQQSFESGHAVS